MTLAGRVRRYIGRRVGRYPAPPRRAARKERPRPDIPQPTGWGVYPEYPGGRR